ncbi:glycosyltransferase family 2 protein [Yersinia intermedia]|uniref:glycosyltransferase family 2 protein n=1 Tax=Yersinia intermedia TaxID=631 RepID=UPI00384CCCAE
MSLNNFTLSVVIATYNRPELVLRAVNSVISERKSNNLIEIIVVDDASTTPQPEFATQGLAYHRMPVNGGPGPARMKGIELASAPWVLILDDDDTLEPGAADYLDQILPLIENANHPVYQFAITEHNQKEKYQLITFDDYVNKKTQGDFTPVFNKKIFLDTGFHYPENRAGGEHLLWWKIAEKFGIPSYNHPLVRVSNDAELRLTHYSSQIKKSLCHKQLAEIALENFGEILRNNHPQEFQRINLALITYTLLSNEPQQARNYLNKSPLGKKLKITLWIISWLPQPLIKKLFLIYRKN